MLLRIPPPAVRSSRHGRLARGGLAQLDLGHVPAAPRPRALEASAASCGAGAVTASRARWPACGSLAWDFAFRIAPIAADAASSRASDLPRVGAAGGQRRLRLRPRGAVYRTRPRCAWIDPPAHHDHASSVTNGRNGANSRSSTESASRSAATADAAAPAPLLAVRPGLGQLQVVVAEEPEEPLGELQAPGRGHRPRTRAVHRASTVGEPAQHGPVERLGDAAATGRRGPAGAGIPSTNLARVEDLDARAAGRP